VAIVSHGKSKQSFLLYKGMSFCRPIDYNRFGVVKNSGIGQPYDAEA
jgi:hypothetical protein